MPFVWCLAQVNIYRVNNLVGKLKKERHRDKRKMTFYVLVEHQIGFFRCWYRCVDEIIHHKPLVYVRVHTKSEWPLWATRRKSKKENFLRVAHETNQKSLNFPNSFIFSSYFCCCLFWFSFHHDLWSREWLCKYFLFFIFSFKMSCMQIHNI